MTEFKRYQREYAERELELTGFMATEFGATCLKFLDDLADVAGEDPESMKTVASMLTRLIDRLPLSAITEQDFYDVHFYDSKNKKHTEKVTNRYEHIYCRNGKFYDDRATAFKLNDQDSFLYIYQNNLNSKKEVTLPYYPQTDIKNIKSIFDSE